MFIASTCPQMTRSPTAQATGTIAQGLPCLFPRRVQDAQESTLNCLLKGKTNAACYCHLKSWVRQSIYSQHVLQKDF